ncbi:MAG: CDP-diacylglycerol--serine O-phosphatidyltransferase [Bacteroidota bacterium]
MPRSGFDVPDRRQSITRRRAARPRRRVVRGIPPVAVPSFFTLMNLLSGFFSVVLASDGRLSTAAWLIVLAGFFDLLDGMMARLANAQSTFGLELDSLADVVSFGLAPSFLLFQFGLGELALLGPILAALPVLCGAVRLARYNVLDATSVGEKKDYFTGLPIPAQAGLIVTFILTFQDNAWFDGLAPERISTILVTMTVGLSALMVSPVRFPALPSPNPANFRRYRWRFLAFGLALTLAILFGEVGLLFSGTVYLVVGLVLSIRWVVAASLEMPLDPPAETTSGSAEPEAASDSR